MLLNAIGYDVTTYGVTRGRDVIPRYRKAKHLVFDFPINESCHLTSTTHDTLFTKTYKTDKLSNDVIMMAERKYYTYISCEV